MLLVRAGRFSMLSPLSGAFFSVKNRHRKKTTENFLRLSLTRWENSRPPSGVDGVKQLTAYVVANDFVLNPAAVYWQSEAQALETLRAPFVNVGDSTCKTSSSVMGAVSVGVCFVIKVK